MIKNWVELHDGEKFGYGGSTDRAKQCKGCLCRDKTIVNDKECGWYKSICKIYEDPIYKPREVMDNLADCKYYRKEKIKNSSKLRI